MIACGMTGPRKVETIPQNPIGDNLKSNNTVAFLGKKVDDVEEGWDKYEPLVRKREELTAVITRRSLFFFFLLVGQSICTQTFFKLSQLGGEYKYNTMSAMTVIECVKLFMTLGQLMIDNGGSVVVCIKAFKGISKRVYLAYMFLAISYAIYNQALFHVMNFADPGTFSLFKSLGLTAVSLLDFLVYRKKLSMAQVYCIMIQVFGIIIVTSRTDVEAENSKVVYGERRILLMVGIVFFGAFNTVYHASIIKTESAIYPMNALSSILYIGGCFFNLLLYFAFKETGGRSFFDGYRNRNVVILIFLHSTVGITISFVYKHGDAVLKTLAQPLASAMLIFISNLYFGMWLDINKISGAGVVIISTMLYLQLLPPPPHNKNSKAPN